MKSIDLAKKKVKRRILAAVIDRLQKNLGLGAYYKLRGKKKKYERRIQKWLSFL